jgi:CHAT domain-containing protein
VLVLSACESAGLATVLLGRGVRAVVASTVPVADDAAVELMGSLHAHLRAGIGPADALARAQVRHGDRGFVCVGAG